MPEKPKYFRKKAIPARSRKSVAYRHGCRPGEELLVQCHYCGAEGSIYWWKSNRKSGAGEVNFIGLTLDHVVPEFKGGDSTPSNLVLACAHCNKSKRIKIYAEFMRTLGRDSDIPPD